MKQLFIISIITIFILLCLLFSGMRVYAPAYQFTALMTGNVIMASLSLLTYLLVGRQLDSRPQVFVRSVYSASFLKLMVCMFSMLLYVMLNRAHIHKPTIFVLFGIYAVYTTIETVLLSKLVRDKQ